ncbi:hypothetical protein [Nocardia vulneris]|uniref:Uncharacterized protein n=1 Tax=Nocardia vulneris TaxID=1141657 RepID=A0ABR4Z5H4_9NOCA|nr:hypothetical protein [Nocardia vulneris]KIA60563.1 hypothetical protein FG87_36220 [Nocardia vulneris]
MDLVTEFVADYTLRTDSRSWAEARDNWHRIALQAWLDAAHERGIDGITVRELCEDSSYKVAVIEVGGREYTVQNLGRGMEVQAKLR